VVGVKDVLRAAVFSALALTLLFVSACGGSKKHVSPATLKSRLLPASELFRFKLYRPFAWSNSVDVAVQGLPLSESTPPSEAVRAVDKAGFEAGVGETLRTREGPEINLEVIKLKSHKGAEQLAAYVYAEALKLPCYGSCSELPGNMPVSGIPGAKGIQQVPQQHPGRNAPPPFVAYGVGFTIGPYLYLVGGAGPPGSIAKGLVIDTARKEYRHVSGAG
jgi:hypothetical protein